MTDALLKYGGHTSLDRPTDQSFTQLEELRLRDYASPSVINAYFAELYQKKSPRRPWIDLSRYLIYSQLIADERKPFIRLNLSGKSYGLASTKMKS